jgi:hypothetical protein
VLAAARCVEQPGCLRSRLPRLQRLSITLVLRSAITPPVWQGRFCHNRRIVNARNWHRTYETDLIEALVFKGWSHDFQPPLVVCQAYGLLAKVYSELLVGVPANSTQNHTVRDRCGNGGHWKSPVWGPRYYQGKISGKEEDDEIPVGRPVRLHLKKQAVLRHWAS